MENFPKEYKISANENQKEKHSSNPKVKDKIVLKCPDCNFITSDKRILKGHMRSHQKMWNL